jgi:hypothetical protein
MKDYGKFEPVHEHLARRSARASDGRAGPRCGCKDPETGRQLGERCPDLRKRHRGTWAIEVRIDTSKGRRELHRAGYAKGRRSRGRARSDPRSRAPGRPRCDPGEDRRPDLDGDPPQRRTARRRGCCRRLALGTGRPGAARRSARRGPAGWPPRSGCADQAVAAWSRSVVIGYFRSSMTWRPRTARPARSRGCRRRAWPSPLSLPGSAPRVR